MSKIQNKNVGFYTFLFCIFPTFLLYYLHTEIEALISEKNAAYNTYRTAKAEYEQLATAKRNAEQILHGTPSRQKKQEQER
ncbi:hypothetical protein [Clostridium sp. KNHs214]|uniref:hypothetical protein n=1 Tax=Clostridium sp. KNHs214 TaxID=1540257 RepID=UPI001639568B|nr:hypothetical protein [Clostridium sp. KNHs214]